MHFLFPGVTLTFASFILFSGVILTTFLFAGFRILFLDPKGTMNRVFFIACILWALVVFCQDLLQFSSLGEEAEFYYKISFTIMYVGITVMIHFFLVFSHFKIRKILLFLLYIPSGIVAVLLWASSNIFSSIFRQNGFWIYFESYAQPWLIPSIIFTILYPGLMVFILLFWHNKSEFNREKKQARILITSILLALTFIQVFDLLLPSFHIYSLPRILPLALSFFIFPLYYVLKKYHFLSFDISTITGEILAHVQDIVIVLRPDFTIMEINAAVEANLGYGRQEILRKSLFDILDKKLKFSVTLRENIIRSKINFLKSSGDFLLTDAYVSKIIDSFGDFSAVLLVAKINPGIKYFQEFYKISSRQMEIILMSIDGSSNNEISQKLNISRRTVETHLFYVYSKIGIGNKVELIKTVNQFSSK